MASHPDPDDEELLMETFMVAMFNGRTAVIEYMASRGCPINSLIFGSPAIALAVGNAWEPVVESLIRCGADLDLEGVARGAMDSARMTARWMLLNSVPVRETNHRIAVLCGLDPEAILAEHAAAPPKEPEFDPRLDQWLRHAGDDAFRLAQPEIGPENLLFALLRFGSTDMFLRDVSLSEQERFYAEWKSRLDPGEDEIERPKIPIAPETQAVIQRAVADAKSRRREWIGAMNLFCALLQNEEGAAGIMLANYGGSARKLRELLEPSL
jgi:hypothetical protein